MVDAQEDPLAPQSGCCGSARWLGDSWLMSWGGTDLITEIDGDGKRTFKLRMPDAFSYRANPVDGAVSASTLRQGDESAGFTGEVIASGRARGRARLEGARNVESNDRPRRPQIGQLTTVEKPA